MCCVQVLYPGARRLTRSLSPSHGLDLFSLASVTLHSSPCIFLTLPHYWASFSALAPHIPSCTWADRFLLMYHLMQPVGWNVHIAELQTMEMNRDITPNLTNQQIYIMYNKTGQKRSHMINMCENKILTFSLKISICICICVQCSTIQQFLIVRYFNTFDRSILSSLFFDYLFEKIH